MAAQTEPRRGERQHAPELAAAENADGGAGLEQAISLWVSWPRPWSAARARRRAASAILASDSASTAAASSAALIAPGLPIASVPTGTPGGICMIEKSESLPSSASVFIGTPSTGKRRHRGGHAGQMGCAAGAGDHHLEAVLARVAGEVVEAVGRAVRGDDQRFMADLEVFQRFGGMLHDRPVGLAAHDDRDRFYGYYSLPRLSPAGSGERKRWIIGWR